MTIDCDPCVFCQNYIDGFDRHSGIIVGDCMLPPEIWDGPGCGKPCKGFFPLFVSDCLFDQLWEEECYEEWKEEQDGH